MIRVKQQVPKVYYNQSRDFQLLGKLFELVLNSVKTNSDMIYDIPSADSAGSKMIDLLALTLGFQSKHNYNIKQLRSICSAFMTILRNKGNIQSVQLAGDALLNAEGIKEKFVVYQDEVNPYKLTAYIPQELSDINLFKDILTYILPAGMTVDIIRTNAYTLEGVNTKIATVDKVNISNGFYDYETSYLLGRSAYGEIKYPGLLDDNNNATGGMKANSTVVRVKDNSQEE